MPRHRLPIALAVVIGVAAAASTAIAQSAHRFTGGPVTLADQGSFFIGGETKISEHATIPGAPPGQTPPPPTPQQVTIGQMYVQFLKLDERGMLGATHMMMLDAKNLEIADLLLEWTAKHVEKAPKRRP